MDDDLPGKAEKIARAPTAQWQSVTSTDALQVRRVDVRALGSASRTKLQPEHLPTLEAGSMFDYDLVHARLDVC